MLNFLELEKMRRRSGMSATAMCRAAHIATCIYFRTRANKTVPNQRTLRRWAAVLAGKPIGTPPPGRVSPDLVLAVYRGWSSHIAGLFHADPTYVLASDPSKRANADPAWALAAKVRALAVYCTVTELNVQGACVAAAIGVTRQAVSIMLKRVEDMRDDPAIDALIEKAGRLISGRAA